MAPCHLLECKLTYIQKTTEEDVLHAAKNESKNVTLVYASEKAMEFKLETQALPGPLEVAHHI
jgi:hypothetical protein